jgi:histidine ammonia-lyase/phenylalanine ammonia-lyase
LQQPTGVHVDLDGRSLTIGEAVRFARGGGRAVLAPEAARRVEQTRALKQDLIAREIPIYGVTTGFGDSAHRQIAPEKAARLQQNMLRFLGAGTGQIASPEVTRATMLFRANCLAKGNSGVRPELIERLLTLLNHDILPLIPERGSCGASGDLVPLSYVGRALAGETEVLYEGEVREAADVLAELGLEPLLLEAKEGLAMTNGTSFMSGFASLAVHDARELAFVADLCTAMASQALMGNHGHFNAFLFEAKPHPGIIESAANVRMLIEGSALTHDAEDVVPLDGAGFRELERSVQDKYSIRCAPHITGALRDTLEWARSGSGSRSTPPTTTRCSTSGRAACRAAATSTAATSRRRWTR